MQQDLHWGDRKDTKTRLQEHKRDVRYNHHAVAYHAHSQLHQMHCDNAQQFYKRRVTETIHIGHTANINQDEGLQLSPIWNDILR